MHLSTRIRRGAGRGKWAMSTEHLVPQALRDLYHVREWRNATGVLTTACPNKWADIVAILREFRLYRSEIQAEGGNRSLISRRLEGAFYKRGWIETEFATAILIDDRWFDSPTHSVDCFKGRMTVEVEWNNRDSFVDRDLNNFRLLCELRAIEVGVMVTRGSELQKIFNRLGKGASHGRAATHHEKLIPRLDGGGGGGCHLLAFAVSERLYLDDVTPPPSGVPSPS
ncbi:MAG: BglII/BstYI family type II restriction endonuclease [Methylocella sp.]